MEIIRTRTRDGYGVKRPGANKTKLKPLSPGYIKQRARDRDLSSETSPSTSNLTRTGAMLDSLFYTVSNGRLTVTVRGEDNVKKAVYVSEDRPFANLSAGEITALLKELNLIVKEEIQKL